MGRARTLRRRRLRYVQSILEGANATYEKRRCPWCGSASVVPGETCDVGVGHVQVSPDYCERCGASELGCRPVLADAQEKRRGWQRGPYTDMLRSRGSTRDRRSRTWRRTRRAIYAEA